MPQTLEASAFIAGLGVNVHLNASGTPYTNTSAVQAAMAYLGLNTMRDMGGQQPTARYAAMAKAGYLFDFFAPSDPHALTPAGYAQWLDAFVQAHPGSLTSIEGPNEVNTSPITYNGSTSLASEAAYQQAMFNAVNADPTLASIPVFNLSLGTGSASAFTGLGNMASAADYGTSHAYMSYGNQPNVQLSRLISYAQAVSPGEPMAITESGYPTLASDTAQGVDQATQAKLTLNLVMDAEKLGDPLFLYELIDNQDSGGGAWNYGGLFNGDWTAKPAATALHNLTTVLTSGEGNIPTAAPTYTVSGLRGYHDSMVVHERNGAYDIVVWAEPTIWNSTTHSEVAAPTQTATINLGQAVTSYSVYDPLTGATAVKAGGPTNSITVQVTDHPVVIELHNNLVAAFEGAYLQYSVGAEGATVTGGPERADVALTNIQRIQFVDGYLAYSPTDTAGQVYRLYEGALGRAPDPAGLAGWTHALNSGMSLASVAAGFIGSHEFQQAYGPLDNTAFVTLLYGNVLHRAPDPGGLDGWLGALAQGVSRAQVLAGFTESAEDIKDLAGPAQQGLWIQDAAAAEVARLYDATLNRLPDLGGLTGWTHALESGATSLLQVAQGFVGSAEFQSTFGTLDDTDFVTLLYNHALHRAPDPPGLDGWIAALSHGVTRAQIVLGFSESAEHIADTAPHIDDGVWLT